jgi:large subunit ribosomal protein L21
MRAVVRIAGTQMSVGEEDVVRVPRLNVEEGSDLHIEDVLLVSDDSGTRVGRPLVDGAAVDAVVVRHVRGPKIEVATFKRRKDFRRHIGHRTEFTEIRVTGITAGDTRAERSGEAGGR